MFLLHIPAACSYSIFLLHYPPVEAEPQPVPGRNLLKLGTSHPSPNPPAGGRRGCQATTLFFFLRLPSHPRSPIARVPVWPWSEGVPTYEAPGVLVRTSPRNARKRRLVLTAPRSVEWHISWVSCHRDCSPNQRILFLLAAVDAVRLSGHCETNMPPSPYGYSSHLTTHKDHHIASLTMQSRPSLPRLDTATDRLHHEPPSERLVQAVAQTLQIPRDDIELFDSFADLGGDGSKAEALRLACRRKGIEARLEDIMGCRTLAELQTRITPYTSSSQLVALPSQPDLPLGFPSPPRTRAMSPASVEMSPLTMPATILQTLSPTSTPPPATLSPPARSSEEASVPSTTSLSAADVFSPSTATRAAPCPATGRRRRRRATETRPS